MRTASSSLIKRLDKLQIASDRCGVVAYFGDGYEALLAMGEDEWESIALRQQKELIDWRAVELSQ